MMASRRFDSSKARLLPIFGLAFVLCCAPGCGDDVSREAGTLESNHKAKSKAFTPPASKGKSLPRKPTVNP